MAILREHKHKVAVRRAIKRIKNQTAAEEEPEVDINNMTTEEQEIYKLKQLMGELDTIEEEIPAIGREQFRKYEYKKCTRILTTSNTQISEWLEI